jgi:Ni,Fe-hydrogenase III small subunit
MRRTLIDAFKGPLTEPAPRLDDPELVALGSEIKHATSASLGRSLAVRHLDAGSCNGCELEIHALNNPFYDLERFGVRFVASPRHADALLVTGAVTRNMLEAVERTYDAMPSPKWVIASGACALDGHVFKGSYALVGGVSEVLHVDLHIPGCPPSPKTLLKGFLALMGGAGAKAMR